MVSVPAPTRKASPEMHELGRFIQAQLDARGWTRADLSRKSGLSESHLGRLVNDPRDRLAAMPDPSTIEALARAFRPVSTSVIVAHAANACYGTPLDGPVETVTAATVDDDELLHELATRLRTRTARQAPAVLDINTMAHQSLPKLVDLMAGLREQAMESEARGEADLALAQRFLADQIKAAFDAAEAANQARTEQRA